MADLTELQAATVTKIAGANSSTGSEDFYVDADSNGNMKVIDYATSATGSAAPSDASFIGAKNPSNNLVGLLADASSNLFVNVAVSVLPTGAATAANQATEIASLALIDNPVGSVAAGTAGTSSFLIGGVFNTSLPTLTTGQQAAIQLDSSGRQIIAPLTNASAIKAQLQDNAGNALVSYNSQLETADIINAGTGTQAAFTVGTTALPIRVGASNLANRKLITIHNNSLVTFFWGYTSAVTTTTGTPILSGQQDGWTVGAGQDVYVIAGTATNNARITEGA